MELPERLYLRLRTSPGDRDRATRAVVTGAGAGLPGHDPPTRRLSPFEFSPLDRGAEPRRDGRLDLVLVDGAAVPAGTLELELGPRRIGGGYLRVFVRTAGGRARFIDALFNDGPHPGQNWIEIVDLDLPPDIAAYPGWEMRLVPYLAPMAAVIPRGGHMMIEYEKTMWS